MKKRFPLGKEYYPKTLIQNLTEELSEKVITTMHKNNYIDSCHKEIDCLKEKNKKLNEELNKRFLTIFKERIKLKIKNFYLSF